MPYDPERHHRRAQRLRHYDYAQAGAYFITICVQESACLFGAIIDAEMRPNGAGLTLIHWWDELLMKFPTIATDAWVVMPNHFHGVIFLQGRPDETGAAESPTLSRVVNWFKTMTTNAYIQGVKALDWPPFPGRLWQRNYYEHVIRNDQDLDRIRRYIADNPARWATDEENPSRSS